MAMVATLTKQTLYSVGSGTGPASHLQLTEAQGLMSQARAVKLRCSRAQATPRHATAPLVPLPPQLTRNVPPLVELFTILFCDLLISYKCLEDSSIVSYENFVMKSHCAVFGF